MSARRVKWRTVLSKSWRAHARRLLAGMSVAAVTLFWVAPLLAQPPVGGQTEFVPVSELPPSEQLPAARLVIVAYAFVWVVLVLYIWSVWSRVRKVESDLTALERRVRPS